MNAQAQISKDFNWAGPCYLFHDMNKQVLNKNLRWDYFRRDWNRHPQKFARDSDDWLIFPTVADAERYLHAQKINLFHCSMQLLQGSDLEYFNKHGQR